MRRQLGLHSLAPVLALALATLVAACATPAPRPAQEVFELDSFRWRAAATPQGAVVARNDWGDLRVRTAARGGLVVSAMVQRIGTTREELAIRIDERPDVVVVEVVPRVRRPRGRVDLTLIVPPGRRLEGTTRDGLAEVKYKGEARVRTRGGAITLEASGHAGARSETGSIVAKLSGEGWQRPLELVSGAGDVTLWLPEDALRAGGPRLRVESASGVARVLSYPRPPPAPARAEASSLPARTGPG